MKEEQIKQKADDYIITRQKHIKYFSGEAVRILLKNFAEEIVAEATKELEKENAELKLKVTALENANRAMVKELDDTTSGGLSILENVVRSKDQLTNAKEIIRELLTCARNYPESNKQKMQKAEQFLKGESTTSNECHDCAKFDEMPKGPRCKTCDNGSRFQKKEEA